MWYPDPLPNDKETTLIVAGDIWIGTRFIEFQGTSWISKIAAQFEHVVIVFGNHCYWGMTMSTAAEKCRKMLADHIIPNVHILDCNTVELNDVVIAGCTLWTDMNKRDPLTMYNMSRYMTYDGKISYKTGPNGYFERFTSERWVSEHSKHKAFIEKTASANKDKKIIVVTHHAPLLTLLHPDHQRDISDGYYASDLSDLILDNPNIVLWCCGHTHHQRDTMMVNTRIINNCLGYLSQHFEQLGLVKHEAIEI